MAARVQFSDGKLARVISRLVDPDFRFLMVRIRALMTEDHTRSILMGIDKDGVSFTPTTYRGDSAAATVRRNRYNRGVGAALVEANDNLSSAEYRRLAGPPLAPRGKKSRIIANFATEDGRDADGTYWATAQLVDVVDTKGRPFMQYHFEGRGRLPKRDDRGIRPWGREEIRKAIQAEVTKLLKGG